MLPIIVANRINFGQANALKKYCVSPCPLNLAARVCDHASHDAANVVRQLVQVGHCGRIQQLIWNLKLETFTLSVHQYIGQYHKGGGFLLHLFESCNSCSVDSFHCNRSGGALVDRLEGILNLAMMMMMIAAPWSIGRG